MNVMQLPLNNQTRRVGKELKKIIDLESQRSVKTCLGTLLRIGVAKEQLNIDSQYRNKKNIFIGKVKEKEIIILHFSHSEYGQDLSYLRRMYKNTIEVYGGQATRFTNQQLTPLLLGKDDDTMTLAVEKCPHDLSYYFKSNNHEAVSQIVRNLFDLYKYTWRDSQQINDLYPRYVSAFLMPEYSFLENKQIENYLNQSEVVSLYKKTQEQLDLYLQELQRSGFARGFGFSDTKPANIVEDIDGRMLFFDVCKPDYGNHWLSMAGQFFQSLVQLAPNSLFSNTFKQALRESVQEEADQELAAKLFALGRMNRILIPCTLRNLAFTKEIGQAIDENTIKDRLHHVRGLMKLKSIDQIIKYNSDEFDSDWHERLADYTTTPEFADNLTMLKQELDHHIPKDKPVHKKLFTFMGVPGSGKSTIAEIITKVHQAIILRGDWVFFEKLRDQIGEDYYKAYVYIEELAKFYLREGYSVILEGNNRTVRNRYEAYKLAKSFGAEAILINIEVDLETAADRVTLKGKEQRTREDKLQGLKVFQSQMEYPTKMEASEAHIVTINGNQSLEKIRRQLQQEISFD